MKASGAQLRPLPVAFGHPGHRHKLAREGVEQQLVAIAHIRDFDGVVDIRYHRQAVQRHDQRTATKGRSLRRRRLRFEAQPASWRSLCVQEQPGTAAPAMGSARQRKMLLADVDSERLTILGIDLNN